MAESLAEGVRTLAGRYEVGERIGRGGMADVFAGTDTRLGRRVAIKLLRANLAEDPAFRARFRREAQDAAKMAHPTIVRVFDAGEEAVRDETGAERLVPFIVMEFIDGRLLSDLLASGPLDPKEAVRIAEQVLVALEVAHRAGIIHRDIKPSNIMIARNGQVKVMDFGIARAVSDTATNLAETSKVVGTAQYFSPEQARGSALDARTDLYSAGVVLFEMLAGRAPFLGDNPVAIAYQHVSAEPPVPSTLNRNVSPALDAVVLKSLAKDPGLRYQSAADFRADLVAAITGELDVRRTAASRPDPFAAALFGSQAAAQQAAQRQLSTEVDDRAMRTQSGPPVLWIWAGVVVLLAIVAAVIYWVATLHPTNLGKDAVVTIPSIVGQRFDDVQGDLQDLGLTIDPIYQADQTLPNGDIISTDPAAGQTVDRGETITVTISSGVPDVAIPDVANMAESAAIKALKAAGFVRGHVSPTTSPDVADGRVVSTDPAGGVDATAPSGSTIDILVSNGLVHVPDMVGKAASDAASKFQSLKLQVNPTIDSSCHGSLVKSQSKKGDIPQGSTIKLVVCGP